MSPTHGPDLVVEGAIHNGSATPLALDPTRFLASAGAWVFERDPRRTSVPASIAPGAKVRVRLAFQIPGDLESMVDAVVLYGEAGAVRFVEHVPVVDR